MIRLRARDGEVRVYWAARFHCEELESWEWQAEGHPDPQVKVMICWPHEMDKIRNSEIMRWAIDG